MKLDLGSLRKYRSRDILKDDSPTLPNIPATPFPASSAVAMDPPRSHPEPSRPPTRDNPSRAANKSSGFFNLEPNLPAMQTSRLEDTMKRLFSEEHLHYILEDHLLFQRFSAFVNKYQPQYTPTLTRYVDLLKATKAIEYANAITRRIAFTDRTGSPKPNQLSAIMDPELEEFTARDSKVLRNEVLSAFITQTLVSTVSDCVVRDIAGNSVPAMTDLLGGLAEVYCLTDPSLKDNPIIYSSEEFYQTTQYGTSYAINRNCRFLQGPETDRNTVDRLSRAIKEGKESCETLLNYRRDGTPFVNLLMLAPLLDDLGNVKYFIGAQLNVSGLIEQGRGIESFRSLLQHTGDLIPDSLRQHPVPRPGSPKPLRLLKQLSQMFNRDEAEIVKQNARDSEPFTGDSISYHSRNESVSSRNTKGHNDPAPSRRTRRIIGGDLPDSDPMMTHIANQLSTNSLNSSNRLSTAISSVPALPGPYKHYILVRPYPSLQIVFTSATLRIPGLLRSKFFNKISGPSSTISALESAFIDGASCTAKIIWLPKANGNNEGRPRWIRCSPLLGADGNTGVWMVILVPVDNSPQEYADSTYNAGGQAQTSDRPSSRQSSATTRSNNDLERRDYAYSQYPVRTASIFDVSQRVEGQGLAIKLPNTHGIGSPPLTPMDRDLFAEHMRVASNHGPREGEDMGAMGFESQTGSLGLLPP